MFGNKLKFLILFIISSTSLSFAETKFQVVTGNHELRDFSIADQRLALDWVLKNGGPNSRAFRLFYLDKDAPELSTITASMLDRLYKMSEPRSMSNCYWTAMAASGAVPPDERLMDLPEFYSLLELHFDRVDHKNMQAGDLLQLKRVRGNKDIHAAIFVGHLAKTNAAIVLTKNGPQHGPYLLMPLDELKNFYYPSTYVAGVFRPKHAQILRNITE